MKIIKRIFNFINRTFFYFYLLTVNITKNIKPLNTSLKNSPLFIVTLTSYGKRIEKAAPYAIYSLFNQTVRPDKIILWLAYGSKIPDKLQKLQKKGLEIKFCEDIRSYTKLIPALCEFPDDILITADDDVYYPSEWFKLLKDAYIKNPDKICFHRAHEIKLDENKNIKPYMEWRHGINTVENPKCLFPTGVGGVLYPPHSFNNDFFDKTKYQTLAPTADDVWFWAMARQNGKEYCLVQDNIVKITEIGIINVGLNKINITKNDEQIKNVINEYPDVYKSIL
jgi:hypothetical protein